MTAADTSVVVPAFASWHEDHAAATAAVRAGTRLPAHVVAESFAVLTRMPPPYRVAPAPVAEFLARRFPDPPLGLDPDAYPILVRRLADAGLAGGSVYDALVGETARRAGAVLLTRDRRAALVYELLGVTVRTVA